jgi:ketosteroid isomerase-like protein
VQAAAHGLAGAESLSLDTESMASANLDLVRSIFADWEHGDFSSVEWAHPDIEWVMADGPVPGCWKGPVGMTEGWREFRGAWEEYRFEAQDYRELDGERVLVLGRFTGRGKASGLEFGQMRSKAARLFHVRGGKVRRLVIYLDRERALVELGLAPETGTPGS